MNEFDCLVVGGGLNGLIASYTLSFTGYKVLLIDKNPINSDTFKTDTRTSAISAGTADVLDTLGVWQTCLKSICPIEYIYIFERGCKPIVSFEKPQTTHTKGRPMGFIVPNSILKQSFLHPNVTYIQAEWQEISCDNDFVYLKTENQTYKAKLLISADGKRSQIADLFGIKRISLPYNQSGLVFNISHELDHKNIAIEEFTPNGPFAVLPLKNPKESSVIWTLKTPIANYIYGLKNTSKFTDLFRNEIGRLRHLGNPAKVAPSSNISIYPIELSFLKNRFHKRILFLGDSYHHIHPVAGQGFNMTIKDIITLYNMSQNAKKLGLDLGSRALLEGFGIQSISEHIKMTLATDVLVRIFDFNPLKNIRNIGLQVFQELTFLKDISINYASGERFKNQIQ